MARSRIKAGGVGLTLGIDMSEVEQTSEIFKTARRRVSRDLRDVMAQTAERVVVPDARRRAGNLRTRTRRVASEIVARKGAGNTIYLTTRIGVQQGRIVGLLEFGGTVHTPIRPRARRQRGRGHAPAIMTPYGPRAAVLGPRHYHGKHFLERARDENLPQYQSEVRDAIVTRFEPLEIR